MNYTNNSIVTRTDIGTGSSALLCTTTYSPCCSSGNRDTQWYFPDGSQVVINADLPYYRTRYNAYYRTRYNPNSRNYLGLVQLHRNPQGTTTGTFRCDIPDASGVLQSIYVGIYDSNTGQCRRWCTFYTVETNAYHHTCLECTHYPNAYYYVILMPYTGYLN